MDARYSRNLFVLYILLLFFMRDLRYFDPNFAKSKKKNVKVRSMFFYPDFIQILCRFQLVSIQIHAHNCQNSNLSPKQYLHYNITQQTKTEIFQVSYNMLLVQCAKLLWHTVATTFCDLLFSSLKQIFDRKIELILFCHIDIYISSQYNFSSKSNIKCIIVNHVYLR